MSSTPQAIATALAACWGGSWRVDSAPLGSSRRTYLARGPRQVVVRLDAPLATYQRLAELRIVPPIVCSGTVEDRSFVAFAFVGRTATPAWLATNAHRVAEIMRRYSADEILTLAAEPLRPRDFANDLVTSASGDRARSVARRIRDSLPNDGLDTTSHGDPNYSNFLVGERLWLIDWDELRRADRMRDAAQFAWWYLPKRDWRVFLSSVGANPDDEGSFYWWVAAESLDVALRLESEDAHRASLFIDDSEAALARLPNPRGRWP